MKDLVKRYPDLDGLMLDRVRYDGISADFSDISRQQFEAYIGQKVEKFRKIFLNGRKTPTANIIPSVASIF
ncbi:hypothetical protein NXX48_24390 [Bacteroides faecis]|uniref:hypothetical protein n=1 Tax=Bacteroides faecis TaxID=674529 RepID=UPI00216685B7|nr:hypothetical protein [Bacteroides faecis]